MRSRRLGRCEISMEMVRGHMDAVAEAFGLIRFVPIRAEHMLETDTVEYVGFSDRFRKLSNGERTPFYDMNIKQSPAGNVELVEVVEVSGR